MKTECLMTASHPATPINFAKMIQPLFASREGALVYPRIQTADVQLAPRFQSRDQALILAPRNRPDAKMDALDSKTLIVPRVMGTVSPIAQTSNLQTAGVENLNLPLGSPRFVNIGTMRKMLNAKNSDLILKRNGSQWEIQEDHMRVDLTDDSVEYRVGDVQVFS
jgi:hypothetical protein